MTAKETPQHITFDQLSELRDKTERVSEFLTRRLKGHLTALYPVLAPKRVFGKFLGAKESAPRAEEAYAQLADSYRQLSSAPFDLRSDLDEGALSALEHGIEVYPWEYTHQAGAKPITITSPVRWVIAYRSDYTFSNLRTAASAGKGELRAASVRQFLVNAIAMQIVLARNPAAVQLLQDLRYELSTETVPGLGKIPLATVSSGIASFRPPDELILSATRFSGVSAFIELVDMEAVRQMRDPLRQQLESILTN